MSEPDPDALAAALVRVATLDQIGALPATTEAVLASGLTDAGLARLAERAPRLRTLMTDGNARVTDAGLTALGGLLALEALDLEYAPVTDVGLHALVGHPTLAWVDLGGCAGVTPAGIAYLRRRRPDLAVEGWPGEAHAGRSRA